MARFLPFLPVALMAFWASCGLGQESAADAPTGHAEQLYRDNCAACHDGDAGGAPTRAALAQLTPTRIRAALETGVMKAQGEALSPTERGLVAEHLGAKPKSAAEGAKRCSGTLAPNAAPLWNRWGNSLRNDRYQPPDRGGLSAAEAATLELRWAFAFPDAARARSQAAVTEEAIFTGSQSGRVYALGLADGCVWWTFDAESEVRSAPTLGLDASGRPDRIYFADFNANVYAVDARTGALIWKQKVQDHPAGTITGSPTLHDGRLYVPMSSTEVVNAYSPAYECCTFRGGVAALHAADGRLIWRSYTVPEPRRTGKNAKGAASWGPSGAPVWSAPTIDAQRGLLYVGTGENYSSPATEMSDAIVALELNSGRVRWVRQTVRGDAWNAACGPRNNRVNCPREDGPDFDFGAPPILVTLANGRDLLLAGQKSGMIYALDPAANGRIVWQQRAGMGGFNGGVHWGMATDGRTLYVGIADTPGHLSPTGPPRQGLHAFDVLTGAPKWSRIEPLVCTENKHECRTALSAAITLTDGVVFAGALNGKLIAYSTTDGRTLWSIDTHRPFPTVNGVPGHGGAIDSAGPVIAGGRLIVNSGYDKFGQIPGNVLLVFGPKAEGNRP